MKSTICVFLIQRFSSLAQLMTHFLDVCHNVAKTDLDIDSLKGSFKNKAWSDLPVLMKLKGNPNVDYKTQHFIQEQLSGNYMTIKLVCLTKQRLTQTKLESFAVRKLYEISWGHGNKVVERKALQWMLEQTGGLQFRHLSLSTEKKRPISSSAMGTTSTEDDQDAGWDFILEYGEHDRSQLKQLRGIHKHINKDGCPIRGWSEKLVQRALDCLANDNCLAKLITRYDLAVQDIHPTFLENIFQDAIGFLLDHSLWLMGEPGAGKTPLARITAMLFSRYHGGDGHVRKHTLPKSKKILSVKSGTQVIDRCWKFLKDRIQISQHSKAGSRLLRAKLRASQYEYWYRNMDLWLIAGSCVPIT